MATEPSSPLPIALAITELEVGGAERCLVELATRLDRARFAPIVYALSRRPAPDARSLVARLETAGVETHFIGARGVHSFPRAVGRLRALLKRQRPLIVQSFLFHANVVSRCAARLAGVPHILSGVRVAERGAAWHLWVDRTTRALVERYVCVSRDVADFTRERLGLPVERVAVIPNGIDCQLWAEAAPADLTALGMAAGRRAVTYVGRLEPQKGIVEFIEQSPRWLGRLVEHDLLLVGEGALAAQIKTTAARLGIASRVQLAGWRQNVAEIYKASDLVVLASRWEGMPNVILEAMAAGRAVVSTDVEGVNELLAEHAASQVVRRGDYVGLAERIVALLSDDAERARLQRANAIRATQFSWPSMVLAYERLFSSLVLRQR